MAAASPAPSSNSKESAVNNGSSPDSISSVSIPESVQAVLEKVSDKETRQQLSILLSRTTTFGFGPDPETAKILSAAESHQEECKLKAFQSSLANKEAQSQRDHEFRKKRLNHQTCQSLIILLVIVAGVMAGLYFTITGNPSLGTPILVASFTMLSGLASRLLASRDKD